MDEISIMSPDLNQLIVRASSKSKSRNFNNSSDNIVVSFELLGSSSILPNMNKAVLTTSKDFITGKS